MRDDVNFEFRKSAGREQMPMYGAYDRAVGRKSPRMRLMDRVKAWLLHPEEEPVQAGEATLDCNVRQEVSDALMNWKKATAYFESVSDPALVDYAIYDMEAAQKRYMYLLKHARMQEAQAQIPQIRVRG